MIIDDSIITKGERLNLKLRELFSGYGYEAYRMSKFEEYDLYAKNKDFLVSDNVITFTDTDGKLMALKPDVTLSIIKSVGDAEGTLRKVFYSENVYRVSKSSGSFREIMQTGLECIGDVGLKETAEVIAIAAKALKSVCGKAALDISSLSLMERIAKDLGLDGERKDAFFEALSEKNAAALKKLCGPSDTLDLLIALTGLRGSVKECSGKLKKLLSAYEKEDFCRELFSLLENLKDCEEADIINLDFSVTGDINYYSGIVFKGFAEGVPDAVLSGGCYDRLMRRMGRKSSAIGFAVYADLLEQADEIGSKNSGEWLEVALPKGRLGEKVYGLLACAGYDCPSLLDPGRKLVFENEEKKIRYFWVKPSDVAVYVERGTADAGIVGKDVLLESESEVYELLDMKTGKCRMCVAAPKGFKEDTSRALRVATKYANITKKYYRAKGRDIDIVHLNGSVEIAPILGLTDVIMDIVETGNTLRENGLEVIETAVPDISARLIANRASFRFKAAGMEKLVKNLSEILEDKE